MPTPPIKINMGGNTVYTNTAGINFADGTTQNTAASSTETIALTTGENINAFQVVVVRGDGLAYIADSGDVENSSGVVGVAITSVQAGQVINVQQIGLIDNLGWSFVPGMTLYLGLIGALVQTPNAGVFELSMGTAISATQIREQIGEPIIFA
jgi:hypothetical protein